MGGKKSKGIIHEPTPFINLNEMDINTLAAFARVEFNQTIDPASDIADARLKVLGFMTNASLDAEAERLQAIKDAKENTHYIGLEVSEEEYQAYIAGWSILKLVPKAAEGEKTGSGSGNDKASASVSLASAGSQTGSLSTENIDPTSSPKQLGEAATRAKLDEDIAELPGDYTDADVDFVLAGMRTFYGSLFTAEDEAKVRAAFAPEEVKKTEQTDPIADLKANLAKLGKKDLMEMCKAAGLKTANTMTEEVLRKKLIDQAEGK
jgi:hypothetical protein